MFENKEILTITEAAGYLQMGKMSIYKLARAKKIPCKMVLNKWRFSRDELKQWVVDGGKK